jgi:GNAT superfamily N-acetyltransferase
VYAQDLEELRDHLLRLDPKSRRSRFAMPVDDAFLVAYATSLMRPLCFVIGWFDEGVLRAAGELRLIETNIAEASFSVEPAWRGRGIGSQLLRRLSEEARELGVRRLYMSCLVENVAMQRLARKFAADLVFDAPMLSDLHAEQLPDALVTTSEHVENEKEFTTAIVRIGPRWLPYPRRRA